jgi:Zn-dependent protease with chaperone function
LVVFYIYVIVASFGMFLGEWSHEGQNDGAILICGILGVMTGTSLLAFVVKNLRTVQVSGGVQLPAGVLPELEALIQDCAGRAGLAPPDAVFITLEANARAYSSGRYALHKQLNHCVFIGAPLLAHLSPSELAAILYHEFGHLLLRRHSWAVSLHCKIEDFLLRCQRAQGRGKGCAAAIVLLPLVVIRLFLAAFASSLRGLSKQEELLVDRLAGRVMGEEAFCEALTNSITVISALELNVGRDRALLPQIAAEFHCRIMAATPSEHDVITTPNYFAIASKVRSQRALPWDDRLARVYDALLTKRKSGPRESHPCLRERIENLGSTVRPALPLHPGRPTFRVASSAEAVLSSLFCAELRETFYRAKLAVGLSPLDGITPESRVEYRCRYAKCPRFGQVELTMTTHDLLLAGDVQYRLRWSEIQDITVDDGSDIEYFAEAARWIRAAVRDVPSDRLLRFKLRNGGMLWFRHWHVLDNFREVEAVVGELWRSPRVWGMVTDAWRTPVPCAAVRLHNKQGVVCDATTTGEDGSFSFLVNSTDEMVVSVRAPEFEEVFATCKPAERDQFPLTLVLQGTRSSRPRAAEPSARESGALVARLPRSTRTGLLGLVAWLLKVTCLLVGFLIPVFLPLLFGVSPKNTTPWLQWSTRGALLGIFCTAPLGWRLGSRLAVRWLLTRSTRLSGQQKIAGV